MVNKETIITVTMMVLITYTLSLSLVSQAFPAGQSSKTLSSSGSIQIQTSTGIGIYENSGCTTSLSSVAWGTLEPGGSNTVTCFIKNEGTTPVTLQLIGSNWTPSAAETYLTLSWNYNNAELSAGQIIQVTLTLDVDSGITGITTFNFDINIVANS